MNVRKEVYQRILKKLENEYFNIQYRIRDNLYRFKELAKEQTVLKRERVELFKLIKKYKNK